MLQMTSHKTCHGPQRGGYLAAMCLADTCPSYSHPPGHIKTYLRSLTMLIRRHMTLDINGSLPMLLVSLAAAAESSRFCSMPAKEVSLSAHLFGCRGSSDILRGTLLGSWLCKTRQDASCYMISRHNEGIRHGPRGVLPHKLHISCACGTAI